MAKRQRLVSGVVCKHSVLGFRGRMWAQLVALLGVGGSTILFSTIRSNVGIIQREFHLRGLVGFVLKNSILHLIIFHPNCDPVDPSCPFLVHTF